MAQTLSKCYMHIVFSTKNRANLLPLAHLDEIHAYITGILNANNCPSIRVGGTENHVHILCLMSRSVTISDLVREVKASSSKWINERLGILTKFAWQEGYACFSISSTHVDAVSQYIENQLVHHKSVTFQEELKRILDKYKVEYNEKYLWE